MTRLFETVTDLRAGADVIARRRFGMIEAAGGQFERIRLRPLPKLVSLPEILTLGRYLHSRLAVDRCRIFYDQPRCYPNYLAVKYIISGRGTSFRTIRRTVEALDEVARIKKTDALLCELVTWRISREMMTRWGWEPHCNSRWRRHYIKRFYGSYPPRPQWLSGQEMISSDCLSGEREPVDVGVEVF
ncbi:MAG: hypothetical protein JXM70_09580 [Pirellulales bacterium]|nr:hypothetical protein [Pirellulales bacterium]